MAKKTAKSPLTKEQIKKFKKLEDKAADNTAEISSFMDDYKYCYGNLAEDLCDAGDKEWARRIYKIVEDKMGVEIDSGELKGLACEVLDTLGDKEWARKIYKRVLEYGDNDGYLDDELKEES